MSEESEISEDLSGGWIQWFCTLDEHQFYCEIDHDFIRDPFNYMDFKDKFPGFKQSMRMILSTQVPDQLQLQNEHFLRVYRQASEIYGLFHAKFILTEKGMAFMRQKFLQGKFGKCPKVYCQNSPCLPIGMAQTSKTTRVKIYCPKCHQVYQPKKKMRDADGAYFGTSFPHILLMRYKELQPVKASQGFVPKIFGFKVRANCQQKFCNSTLQAKQNIMGNSKVRGK